LDIDAFTKTAGYDLPALPDANYILRHIYRRDGTSPFIRSLPPKAERGILKNLHREFEPVILERAIMRGKIAKDRGITFNEIKGDLDVASKVMTVYHLGKFGVKQMERQIQTSLDFAGHNPVGNFLLNHYKVVDAVQAMAQNLSEHALANAEETRALPPN
jgi:hypothetical protein